MIAVEAGAHVSKSDVMMLGASWWHLLLVEAHECLEFTTDRSAQIHWLQKSLDVQHTAPMPQGGQGRFEFHKVSAKDQTQARRRCVARLAMSAAHFPPSSRPLVLFATLQYEINRFEDEVVVNELSKTPFQSEAKLAEFVKSTTALVLAKVG